MSGITTLNGFREWITAGCSGMVFVCLFRFFILVFLLFVCGCFQFALNGFRSNKLQIVVIKKKKNNNNNNNKNITTIIINLKIYCQPTEGRKEGNVLFNDTLNTFLFTVIWRHIYGKGPFRWRERKPAATTWVTLSN